MVFVVRASKVMCVFCWSFTNLEALQKAVTPYGSCSCLWFTDPSCKYATRGALFAIVVIEVSQISRKNGFGDFHWNAKQLEVSNMSD